MNKTAFIFAAPKSLLLLFFCYSTFLFVFAKPEMACSAVSTIADTPCDTLYYETMSSRAWLEAQREITQNQNFILKPDSVFQYACFDRFLRELADHASNMLSETGDFGGPLGSSSMDDAINALVINSLTQYITNNFNTPNLLSGHSAASAIPSPMPSAMGAPMTYSCDIMLRVWNAARCTNFISYPEYDGFYTFQEYVDPTNADPRHLPNACSVVAAASTAATKLAYGTNLAAALTTGPWSNDPVQTFYNLTGPQTFGATPCTGTCACTGAPIPTGIKVFRSGGTAPTDYDEHVCLQAGCRYHPGGILYGSTAAAAGCYAR